MHALPAFLPDGRHFLYSVGSGGANISGIYVGSLDTTPEQENAKRLLATESGAVYVPASNSSTPDSTGGHLLFAREGSLMAQPFDAGRIELMGDPVPIAENLVNPGIVFGAFSASTTGVLAFRSGGSSAVSRLTWLDRTGKTLGHVGPPGTYVNLDLSPDTKTVAVHQVDPRGRRHIWVADLERGIFSRLNPGETEDYAQEPSPDGRVAFTFAPTGVAGDLYLKLTSGVGDPELLVKSPTMKHANGWSPDGRFLIYDDHVPAQRQDLWIVPLAGDRKPIPFLTTPADEVGGQFSPDGKWIAYSSDESGRHEVYVRDFAPDRIPATGSNKWQISIAGGSAPKWPREGKEIFYLAPDGKLMAVPVKTSPAFEPGVPIPLFEINSTELTTLSYDVAADGKRFLTLTQPDAATLPLPITLILNWKPPAQ